MTVLKSALSLTRDDVNNGGVRFVVNHAPRVDWLGTGSLTSKSSVEIMSRESRIFSKYISVALLMVGWHAYVGRGLGKVKLNKYGSFSSS